MARITLVCAYCNKPKSAMKSRPFKYCCAECKYKAIAERYHGEGNPRYKPSIEKRCDNCGKAITVFPSSLAVHNFCDRKCRTAWRNRARVNATCIICNEPITFSPNKPKKTCSKRCTDQLQSIQQRGDLHWRWIGGKPVFYGKEWDRIAKEIRQRDNYQCQYCGKKHRKDQKAFDVHHIKPLRDFNGDYKQANQPHNLITLCMVCHRYVESGRVAIQPKLL